TLDLHPEICLLFTDVVLPGMNGRQLAEEASKKRPGLKAIPFSRILHNILDPAVLDEEPVLLKGQYWRCSGDGVSGHGPERLLSC
ncbi:MAG TPA: hypothetical protein VGC48_05120, partial [Gemmatimonadales bacterium]